jgi:hypothetical protein
MPEKNFLPGNRTSHSGMKLCTQEWPWKPKSDDQMATLFCYKSKNTDAGDFETNA